ncbi:MULTISPECIES: hypothetical protein [unclassified Pseudarthrobacter]|uniref:hypothetical protein n=1 Tax=unclassified Pseudarthrobacter TaxID=2647000 RepID=UPI002499B2F8|nr:MULTISPECIES: hypothetical protein [unclassified Pseudarthrobacter]MDI3196139.1 hypothetical protein [Pseudarthrobacter sp. AL20]
MTTVIGESLEDTISDPRRPGEVQAHVGGSPPTWLWAWRGWVLATNLVPHYADDPHVT